MQDTCASAWGKSTSTAEEDAKRGNVSMHLHMKVNGNGHLLVSACTRKCVCVFVRVCVSVCMCSDRQTHSLGWKGGAVVGDFRLWVTLTVLSGGRQTWWKNHIAAILPMNRTVGLWCRACGYYATSIQLSSLPLEVRRESPVHTRSLAALSSPFVSFFSLCRLISLSSSPTISILILADSPEF